MKYGLCGGPEIGPLASANGYDYIEVHVQKHLAPESEDAAFERILADLKKSPVPTETANCLLPGNLKITGPQVEQDRIVRYMEKVFARAERAGVRVIVFGSGAARTIPEGFDPREGWHQLIGFGRLIGPLAHLHGVTLAVEPLNRRETNVFTTVAETARYVREVNHPAVCLLVDSYHWSRDNDSPEAIVEAGDLLCHVHVGTAGRMAPGLEPHDFGPFFRALKKAGYDGRISIEAKFNNLEAEAAASRLALAEALAQA